ncbi:hypothetical protein ABT173_22425 [Streptomyces sp. NPDC001795]|uniref:hypothetical protein n=1 Tax=unclassified Streptomyces TaxID=2593676 RepID=UPI00331D6C30
MPPLSVPADNPFLPLPRVPDPHRLEVDEPAWTYPSSCAGGGGIALLRVWRTADGGYLAILTENGIGVSITNAAEEIGAKLAANFPGPLVVLEHYRAGDGADHERLDQVLVLPGRSAQWRAVWPVPPANPDYAVLRDWMRDYGTALLTARA